MFDGKYGSVGSPAGAGASWGNGSGGPLYGDFGEPETPHTSSPAKESMSYGYPSETTVENPVQFQRFIEDMVAYIETESTFGSHSTKPATDLSLQGLGAVKGAEAQYTLDKLRNFAQSRNAPNAGNFLNQITVSSTYPNGVSSTLRYANGGLTSLGSSMSRSEGEHIFNYGLEYKKWTTGEGRKGGSERYAADTAPEVKRNEAGVPISVSSGVSSGVSSPVDPPAGIKGKIAQFPLKVKNHLIKPDQPFYKQPWIYYAMGIGVIGFFIWNRKQD